jgi:hypothetical protein
MNCIDSKRARGLCPLSRRLRRRSARPSRPIYPLQHFLAAVCEPLHLQQQPSRHGQLPHNEEFFEHFAFLVTELKRVMRPGRNVSFTACCSRPAKSAMGSSA